MNRRLRTFGLLILHVTATKKECDYYRDDNANHAGDSGACQADSGTPMVERRLRTA
jgi:hypothetical protein